MPGADLAGFNVACRTVGGDYYDFFPYPDGRVALALGDVSGKGMPASLMMMALHARVQVLAEDPGDLGAFHDAAQQGDLRQVPEQPLHHLLFLRPRRRHRRAAYANAGHNPPILVRANGRGGDAGRRRAGAGHSPIAPYSEKHAQLNHGDMLVLYSDGVTEANNADYDEFDEERFIEVLQATATRRPREIVRGRDQGA